MEINDFESKNSNNITQEERDAMMERLKNACRSKGITVAWLQLQLGRANAYFRNMGYITPRMALRVKQYIPDLNIDYINNGIGEPFIEEIVANSPLAKENSTGCKVKLLPVSSHAGTLSDFSDGVSESECETIISPVKDVDFAITVTGDSMSPEYPNGCKVLIRKINEKAFIDWGRTYVLDTVNGAVIKNIYPNISDDTKIICRSVNPNYPDFTVAKEDVHGWYRVVLQMALK